LREREEMFQEKAETTGESESVESVAEVGNLRRSGAGWRGYCSTASFPYNALVEASI
jgi:hypothetical protein